MSGGSWRRRSAANAFVKNHAATTAFDPSVEHAESNSQGEPENGGEDTCIK